jgi:hypothetical protein
MAVHRRGRTACGTVPVGGSMQKVMTVVAGAALAVALAPVASAQWSTHPTRGVPRTADGSVEVNAPAPRTPDGRPDFSGNWERSGGGGGGRGAGAGAATPAGQAQTPPLATFWNAGANVPDGLPFQPWAAALREQRMADGMKDNPDAWCLPMGFLQFHLHPQPRRMVQTPDLLMIVYEANYGLRNIFLDGRELPPQGEPQPWWYGYSVGRWEGDELVVTTNNLRGAPASAEEATPLSTIRDGWLDVQGSPYTEAAVITERFRRPDFGTLEIDVTVDDPTAYTRPFTLRVNQRIMVDEELIEFVCNENERSTRHF